VTEAFSINPAVIDEDDTEKFEAPGIAREFEEITILPEEFLVSATCVVAEDELGYISKRRVAPGLFLMRGCVLTTLSTAISRLSIYITEYYLKFLLINKILICVV
jgi:hypothetical protein